MVNSENLEITKMLTVSISHIKEETVERLSLDGIRNEIMLPVYTKNAPGDGEGFGLYVYLDKECINWDKIPEDLAPVIRLAEENGCGILCFDNDGPELNGLTIYDWEC